MASKIIEPRYHWVAGLGNVCPSFLKADAAFYTQSRHKLNIKNLLSLRERARARALKKFNL
jgi:hypothetical protein